MASGPWDQMRGGTRKFFAELNLLHLCRGPYILVGVVVEGVESVWGGEETWMGREGSMGVPISPLPESPGRAMRGGVRESPTRSDVMVVYCFHPSGNKSM